MRIKHIEGVHVRVPLGAPYRNARGQMDAFDSVIVRIETDDGLVGYGESVPFNFSATDPRAHLGDARVQARLINGPIASALAGTDPLDIEALVTRAAELAGPNVDAIAGVDLALWDLMGKSLGQPAYRLLGGVCQDAIPVDFTIGARSPADTAAFALEVHRDGFQGVVVKVPCRSTAEDVERVRAVRSALPAHCTVRVDCNTGHTREGAIDFIRRIAEFDIEFVEQPVAAADLDGLRLCRSVGVPISADESLNTLRDAIDLVKRDACDVMNIKVPKVGGLLFSKRVAAVAAARGAAGRHRRPHDARAVEGGEPALCDVDPRRGGPCARRPRPGVAGPQRRRRGRPYHAGDRQAARRAREGQPGAGPGRRGPVGEGGRVRGAGVSRATARSARRPRPPRATRR